MKNFTDLYIFQKTLCVFLNSFKKNYYSLLFLNYYSLLKEKSIFILEYCKSPICRPTHVSLLMFELHFR